MQIISPKTVQLNDNSQLKVIERHPKTIEKAFQLASSDDALVMPQAVATKTAEIGNKAVTCLDSACFCLSELLKMTFRINPAIDYQNLSPEEVAQKMYRLELTEHQIIDITNSADPKDILGRLKHQFFLFFSGNYRKKFDEMQYLVHALTQALEQRKQALTDMNPRPLPDAEVPMPLHFSTRTMEKKYLLDDPANGVAHFTSDQLGNCELTTRDGLLFRKDGIMPLNTTAFFDQELAFVMSNDGRLFAHPSYKHVVHHSTFFSGQDVACAGEMVSRNGKIIHVNNGSGHYKPTAMHLLQGLARMHELKVLHPDATVGLKRTGSFRAKDIIAKLTELGRWPENENDLHSVFSAPLVRADHAHQSHPQQ